MAAGVEVVDVDDGTCVVERREAGVVAAADADFVAEVVPVSAAKLVAVVCPVEVSGTTAVDDVANCAVPVVVDDNAAAIAMPTREAKTASCRDMLAEIVLRCSFHDRTAERKRSVSL